MKILVIDNGQPFNLNSLYTEPLGGSESSAILLATALSLFDHNVIITTSSTNIADNLNPNLKIFNFNESYNIAKEADIIILNRIIPNFIPEIYKMKKKIYYYTHDAYDQIHILSNLKSNLQYINKILFVSEWQKETFKSYLNINHNYLIIGNPIVLNDSLLIAATNKRNNNKIKLCYHSIPYKGLEIIPEIYNRLYYKFQDKIELEVLSNMSLYGQSNDKYDNILQQLSTQPNVTILSPMSRNSQLYHLSSSHILLSPCLYHETFGINYILARSVGCLPVTINTGANKEVNISQSIVDIPTLTNIDNFNIYFNYLCSIIDENNFNKYEANLISNLNKYDYINIALKFLNNIEE